MPYDIKKEGDKFCVVKKDGGKRIGCHDTRKDAEDQIAAIHIREASMNQRALTVALEGYTAERKSEKGREYLVVPVVALKDNVVWASNSEAPELVTASEFAANPEDWTDRPVMYDHPKLNGKNISASAVKQTAIGFVRTASRNDDKLQMEVWVDAKRAPVELVRRLEAGERVEVSVGVGLQLEETEGEYKGKRYAGIWRNVTADHLALLPEGVKGACNFDMGCGVRAASKGAAVAKKTDKTFGAMFVRMMGAFRAAQPADEMSSNDLNKKLNDALRKQEGATFNYIETFYPVTDPDHVVYSCYDAGAEYGYSYKLFERAFTLDGDGVVTLDAERTEVEPVMYYEPVDKTQITAAAEKPSEARNAAEGGPCSCKNHVPASTQLKGEMDMTKEQIAKFLETATDEQIKALSAAVEGENPELKAAREALAKANADLAASQEKVTALEAKTFTIEDAPADIKAAHAAGVKLITEKRAASVKALKDTGRCKLTDEQLAAKSQEELDQLVELAGQPATERAATDFSGQGAPRQDAPKEAPAAPDLGAEIRAARAKK